jgi:methyl-accepting chemotaxis protein WspA
LEPLEEVKVSGLFLRTLFKLLLLFLLIAASTTLYSGWNLRTRLTEEFQSKGRAISNSVANSALEIILNRDASSVQALIDQFTEISGVGYVYVVDENREIIAHTFAPTIPQNILELSDDPGRSSAQQIEIEGFGRFTDVSAPMLGGAAGSVHVGMDHALIESHIKDASVKYLSVILVLFLISAIAAYFVTSSIVQPVQEAANVAQSVAAGDLRAIVKQNGADELGVLLGSIKTMTENLSSVVGRVQRSGSDLVRLADRIAVNSRALDAAVHQFGAFTGEIVASTTQISATSQQLVRTVESISKMVEDAAGTAASGKQGLMNMHNSFRRSLELTSQISAELTQMKGKTENMTVVTTTMTKVADRTNLLSLNAAIEAQKANSGGAGFGVVASEIRRLADQTAVSTLDIERLILDLQNSMNHSVSTVRRFSKEIENSGEEIRKVVVQLSQVIEQVQSLSPSFQSMNEGTTSQAEGAQNIQNSMLQLRDAAETTGRAVQEFQLITDDLQSAARSLNDEVSKFKLS